MLRRIEDINLEEVGRNLDLNLRYNHGEEAPICEETPRLNQEVFYRGMFHQGLTPAQQHEVRIQIALGIVPYLMCPCRIE